MYNDDIGKIVSELQIMMLTSLSEYSQREAWKTDVNNTEYQLCGGPDSLWLISEFYACQSLTIQTP